MTNPPNEPHKNPLPHLQIINVIIAVIAGSLSIVGGVYSLKANFFTPKTGTLQGIVQDEKISKPLWQAPVEISTPDGAIIGTYNTDVTGHYASTPLREGNYIVTVSAPMHKTETKNVKIYPNNEATVNFDVVPEEPPAPAAPVVQAPPVAPVPTYPVRRVQNNLPQDYSQTSMDTSGAGSAQDYTQRPRRNRWWNNNQPSNNYSNVNTMTSLDQNQVGGQTAGAAPQQQNTMTQLVGQLVQNWLKKNTGSTAGSGSSSGSSTGTGGNG